MNASKILFRSTYLVPNTTDCQEWKYYNHQLECWVVHVGLLYSLLFALNQGIAEKQQVQQQQRQWFPNSLIFNNIESTTVAPLAGIFQSIQGPLKTLYSYKIFT